MEDVAGAGLHAALGSDLNPFTSWVGSPYGHALFFNGASGNSRLVVADPGTDLLDGTSRLSVEISFRPAGVTGVQGLVGKYWPGSGRRGWRLYLQDDEIALQLSADGENNETQTTTAANLSAGTWYQVVMTFNAGLWATYVNGRSVPNDGPFSQNLSIFGSTEEMRVGNRSDSSPFVGPMTSVRVWRDRVLTADDVLGLYERPWAMYDATPYLPHFAVEASAGAGAGPWLFWGTAVKGAEEKLLAGLPNGVSFDIQIRTVDKTGNKSTGSTPVSGTPTAPATHDARRFRPLQPVVQAGRVRRKLR